MAHRPKTEGIRKLIKKYILEFRIPENLGHYSPEDYAEAEKRFVKYRLKEGCPPGERRAV
jgi:hypothetical protein